MQSGYSFYEFAEVCLMLEDYNGNATDGVRKKEKNSNRRVSCRCTFVSVDRRLQETGTFHGMRQNVGRPRSVREVLLEKQTLKSLKDSLPSVPDILLLAQVSTMLLYTVDYMNSSCVHITFSLCNGSTRCAYEICILSMEFATFQFSGLHAHLT
jgi:hypothetical protein